MMQARVQAMATRQKLLFHHCRDSRWCQGRPGFPDLIVAGTSGVIAAELKLDAAALGPGQSRWRWALQSGPLSWALWTPDQLADGTIADALEEIS